MHPLGKTSSHRLSSCHNDWKVICEALCKWVNYSVFCGHRGELAQNQAFFNGTSELEWPNSKHNTIPSLAIDMGPYFSELKNTDWEDANAFAMFAGMVLLVAKQLYVQGKISHQVIWGGDWDSDGRTSDHKFRDFPHFELTKDNVWNL